LVFFLSILQNVNIPFEHRSSFVRFSPQFQSNTLTRKVPSDWRTLGRHSDSVRLAILGMGC
jgi:hypothetical protein